MNPFGTVYNSEFFCDRENELLQLKLNIDNGLNTMLHSPRRLGKTALIFHLFHQLEESRNADTIYIDLFATSNMEDLIRLLAERILKKYHKLNFMKGVTSLLKGLMATITLTADGTPQLNLNIKENQYKQSLDQLFSFLETQKRIVVIAFDEFQEVGNYPEKAEAELRSHLQYLKNVKFIFSGSSSHLLQEMFQSPKRPFYQSTEIITLDKINRDIYTSFIEKTFAEFNKCPDKDAIEEILNFTDGYTYYTQVICNHCFAKVDKNLCTENVKKIKDEFLESRKVDYNNLLSLLAPNQRKVAIAIAKEEEVKQATSMEFLMKYKLPSISSTSQAVNTLLQKEIVYNNNKGYIIYDVFFKRFLQRWF